MKLLNKILDGDGHVMERDSELYEYLEPPYSTNKSGMLAYPFFPTLDGFMRGCVIARLDLHKDYMIDAKVWLDFLDATDTESTVLYPTAALSVGLIQDLLWARAVARAYNNWLVDRFYKVSKRLRGMAILPLQDVPEAVKELRRAVAELGMVGACLPANGGELGVRRGLGHTDFWPVYEEAERLDVPLVIHGAPSLNLGMNFNNYFAETQLLEHTLALCIQFTSVMMGGVLERFPKLKVGFFEGGVGWVPYMIDRLDRSFEIFQRQAYREFSPWLKKKPSEYLKSGRVFFTCEGGEPSLSYTAERIGHGSLIFASDFPHETNLQRAKVEIAEILERRDISDEAKQAILCDNVGKLYSRVQ